MEKIRIGEAKAIAERLGADAVAIIAFRGDHFTATSYGATKAKCAATGEWLDEIVDIMQAGALVPRL